MNIPMRSSLTSLDETRFSTESSIRYTPNHALLALFSVISLLLELSTRYMQMYSLSLTSLPEMLFLPYD